MLDAGATKVYTYLSALNCHTLEVKSLKRSERYVGKNIESLANDSCVAAIEDEKVAIIAHENKK